MGWLSQKQITVVGLGMVPLLSGRRSLFKFADAREPGPRSVLCTNGPTSLGAMETLMTYIHTCFDPSRLSLPYR